MYVALSPQICMLSNHTDLCTPTYVDIGRYAGLHVLSATASAICTAGKSAISHLQRQKSGGSVCWCLFILIASTVMVTSTHAYTTYICMYVRSHARNFPRTFFSCSNTDAHPWLSVALCMSPKQTASHPNTISTHHHHHPPLASQPSSSPPFTSPSSRHHYCSVWKFCGRFMRPAKNVLPKLPLRGCVSVYLF